MNRSCWLRKGENMEFLKNAIDVFFSFKAYVMLPFFIFIIALIVRMKPGAAFLSALKMGAGFAGVFIIFNFFVDNIKPAVQAIIEVQGLDFPVLDVGWPPLAAITWGSSIAPLSVLIIIAINIVMIATNTCKTIYIDIWNYWHLALAGALVLSVTENIILGIIAVILITVFSIKMADWTAPHVASQTSLKAVTIAPVSVTGILPFAVALDFIYDKIPGFRKIKFNPEEGKTKIGLLGEPMIIGVIIGLLLGIFAGYSFKNILELSIHLAAVMFLLPKCGAFIADGINPVSEALKALIKKRFPKKQHLYVAVDTGVLMNNKSVMITGLILMPVAIGLSLIIPGNKTLPLGDLPNLISIMSVTVLVSRNNVFRSVLTGIPVVISFLLISSALAPLITSLSVKTGISFGEGQLFTAFTDGGHHLRFYLLKLFQGNIVALILIPVILLLMFLTWRRAKKTEAAAFAENSTDDSENRDSVL
jgi:galactitol PTS system EIIC component